MIRDYGLIVSFLLIMCSMLINNNIGEWLTADQ